MAWTVSASVGGRRRERDSLQALEDVAFIVGAAGLALTTGLFVFAILRAAQYQPQAMLVVVLGTLAFVSLVLFAATSQSELITIAATAVGAMAGALTTLFKGPSPTPTENGPQEPSESATEEDDKEVE